MKLQFKSEITLGNILQVAVMICGIIAYFVNNEHRLTKDESRIDNHEERIVCVENIVIKPHLLSK